MVPLCVSTLSVVAMYTTDNVFAMRVYYISQQASLKQMMLENVMQFQMLLLLT